jgi:hypothetical protein
MTMKSKYAYLCVWHDRHTDDKFEVYLKEADAVKRCKNIVENIYTPEYTFTERSKEDYGSFSLWASDDYFVSVEKVEIIP